MSYGFTLKKLVVTGHEKEPALLEFSPTMTIITGASNTGKTYAFATIYYLLNGNNPPKSIEPADGYQFAHLEISDSEMKSYTIRRHLKGGAAEIFECPFESLQLEASPPKIDEGLNEFLLRLSKLEGKRVKKNEYFETANLTFRYLKVLCMVDETSMIAERSPIISENRVQNTPEKSSFDVIISGSDYSGVVSLKKPATQKIENIGRIGALEEFVSRLKSEISDTPTSSEEAIDHLNEQIERVAEHVSNLAEMVNALSNSRQAMWTKICDLKSRIRTGEELESRFQILNKQYESDLERILFISEGEHLFSQLRKSICPYCGGEMNQHFAKSCDGIPCIDENFDDMQNAAQAEGQKIKTHLKDLGQTMANMKIEREVLTAELTETEKAYKEANQKMEQVLSPRLREHNEALRTLKLRRNQITNRETLEQQLALVEGELEEAKRFKPAIPKKGDGAYARPAFDTRALRGLCDHVETILKSWGFAEDSRVEFNSESADIVVSGEPRQSFGKGYRAIMYSAFTLGIAKHCRARNLGHTGWVILDSPLTTLREETTGADDIEADKQKKFFASLANQRDLQVVVFENKEPEISVRNSCKYYQFTGDTNSGRAGFYPIVDVQHPSGETS